MCIPLAAAVIGSAILGAGVSLYSSSKSRSAASKAQQQNVDMAQQQSQRAEQQFNRLNQKQPGIAQLFANNLRQAQRGLGSTFLTGTKGVASLTPYLGGGASVLGT